MGQRQATARESRPIFRSPREEALRAIERKNRARIHRNDLIGAFEIVESFRKPAGIWWVRARSQATGKTEERLIMPSEPHTPLRAGSVIFLTVIRCGESVIYEAR